MTLISTRQLIVFVASSLSTFYLQRNGKRKHSERAPCISLYLNGVDIHILQIQMQCCKAVVHYTQEYVVIKIFHQPTILL